LQPIVRMNRILVGLDGSSRERGILDAAVNLAKNTGAKLVLFRAVGLPHDHDLPPDAYAMAPNDVKKALEQRARGALETLASKVPASVLGGIRVIVGAPWEAIDRMATAENADLIVIGSHGYDALDRVLGTTAAKVVNHATCSVLVVRQPERL
jgi:nucleotide-binding universal stress UspA family protein